MLNSGVIKRSLLYFAASFLNAGLQNVIPQVFFHNHYPKHQQLLLSICLLAGAASSLMTIFFTHEKQIKSIIGFKRSVIMEVLLIFTLMMALWFWKTAVLYILTFLFTRAFIQLLYNRMDHYYVSLIEHPDVNLYARSATLFQLFGIMTGPLYFSIVYAHRFMNIIVLTSLSLILLWSFSGVFQLKLDLKVISGYENKTDFYHNTKSNNSYWQSLVFIVYLLAATTGVHIFSNNLIMIIRDSYKLNSAVIKSGLLLLLMNASGIITVTLLPILTQYRHRHAKREGFTTASPWYNKYTVYAIVFLICVTFLKWPLVVNYPYLVIMSIITGSVYGAFWMKTREYAVRSLASLSKKSLLTVYNNANNFSILFSATVLFLSALISSHIGTSYLNTIMNALIIFFAISACFAVILDYHNKRNHVMK